MIELATTKNHHRLFYALAAAAGLGLGLALIALCDAWYTGSGFNGVQLVRIERNFRTQIDGARELIISASNGARLNGWYLNASTAAPVINAMSCSAPANAMICRSRTSQPSS
jgi:hypothetical protein